MTPKITTTQPTMPELWDQFQKTIGPVFCTPTRRLLGRYPEMVGYVGMVKPLVAVDSSYLRIDWSLNAGYFQLLMNKPYAKDSGWSLDDVTILPMNKGIPEIAHKTYKTWSFDSDFRRQDIVCISLPKLLKHYQTKGKYSEYHNLIGVVTECNNPRDGYTQVSFIGKGYTVVGNIDTKVLVKLPQSFKPVEIPQKNYATGVGFNVGVSYKAKPKYTIGSIVRVSSTSRFDSYIGLAGVIKAVKESQVGHSSYYYTINFNTLANRNLSLIEGEEKTIVGEEEMAQWDLEEWNPNISDRPDLLGYYPKFQRDQAWSPEFKRKVKLHTKISTTKSVETGLEFDIEVDKVKIPATCRDIDYIWDKSILFEVLKVSTLSIGIEDDRNNPNEPRSRVYIYVFDSLDSYKKVIKYKIYLGELSRRPSLFKRFVKHYINKQFSHPWQILRYLNVKSVGYLYQIFNATEWSKDISKFIYD